MDRPRRDPWTGETAWFWVVIIGAFAMALIGHSNPFGWLMETYR